MLLKHDYILHNQLFCRAPAAVLFAGRRPRRQTTEEGVPGKKRGGTSFKRKRPSQNKASEGLRQEGMI